MRVYLDHNATTPLDPEVGFAMSEAASSLWGNPSSLHAEGQAARAAVETARGQVARLVGATSRELVFTSGATESCNWVHQTVPSGGVIVTTAVEHPAVLAACERAVSSGGASECVHLPVDPNGQLSPARLERLLAEREDIGLVSVMYVNNETGNVLPIGDIARICRAAGVACHTDATQAVGRLPVSFAQLGVTFASFSAHKMYGPKGVGALYIASGASLDGLLVGGHQERARRPGTENLLGVIGFGAAASRAGDIVAECARQRVLRDRFLALLREAAGDALAVNTDLTTAAPGTLNVSFLGYPADAMLIALDLQGVAVSAGSACSAGSLEPSHVIVAMTADPRRQRSAIRFSLGRATTEDEIDRAARAVRHCLRTVLASRPPLCREEG